MKKLLITILTLSWSGLTLAGVTQPTLYTCKGNNISVNFSTTSFVGKPSLSVTGKYGQYSNVTPSVQNTATGILVSGYEDKIADATRAFSLIIPPINLGAKSSVTFKTIGIFAASGDYFPGQPVPEGIL